VRIKKSVINIFSSAVLWTIWSVLQVLKGRAHKSSLKLVSSGCILMEPGGSTPLILKIKCGISLSQ
jgi:hypothetical protein